jgi:hypothetical protein
MQSNVVHDDLNDWMQKTYDTQNPLSWRNPGDVLLEGRHYDLE